MIICREERIESIHGFVVSLVLLEFKLRKIKDNKSEMVTRLRSEYNPKYNSPTPRHRSGCNIIIAPEGRHRKVIMQTSHSHYNQDRTNLILLIIKN